MSWAARRRFIVLLIIGAVVVAVVAATSFATLHRAPTCVDGVQNQNESGVDCGGPCAFLCTADEQPPTVLFTQALTNGAGRTDVIASVENKNATAAARNVPYTITLYGADQMLVQTVSGTFDLPPGRTVPVYVPGISSGNQIVARAFLDIASSSPHWVTMTVDPRIVPLVSNTTLGGTAFSPRIEAVFTNPSVTVLANVKVIVLVHGASGDVIAASQTIVPTVSAQGQATATFTWNSAFVSPPVSIEVIPVIPLPDRQAGLP